MLSPCLFNLYAEYIMRNAGLEEAQAGIKIAGRNINNLRYADDTNQSILKEISPGISLEGMMLKLKFQYFGHLMWSVNLLEKTLGKEWRQEEKGVTEMRWLDGITDWMDMTLSKL